MSNPSITVVVKHGAVQEIRNLPDDLVVEVRDYDVDALARTKRDDDGEPYDAWEFSAALPHGKFLE
jgi:hypothetical protein